MQKRLLSIDALRGLAALVVVFYHARGVNWVGINAMWHANKLHPNLNAYIGYLNFPFIFGFGAVSLFFVVSGYCIHRPHVTKLTQDENYEIDKRTYFARRFWRMYPVLIASLVFTSLTDLYTAHYFPGDTNLGDNGIGSFLTNLLSLQYVIGPTYGTNLPLWTLGMEIHFYIAYPLLFWATKRLGPSTTFKVVAAISFISLTILHVLHSSAAIFLSFWFTWSVGFLVAEHEAGRYTCNVRKWRFVIAMLFLVACALTLKDKRDLADPFYAPAFGTLLLWSISARGEAFWSKHTILARIGVVSFSLYAFHYPFIVFLHSLWLNGAASTSIGVPIIISIACVGLGFAMFWLVERWSLKLPRNWSWINARKALKRTPIQW